MFFMSLFQNFETESRYKNTKTSDLWMIFSKVLVEALSGGGNDIMVDEVFECSI